MTPTELKACRELFERGAKEWLNYSERTLVRDGRYPDYYGNPVVQGAWEGFKMCWNTRAPSDEVEAKQVIAASALSAEYTRGRCDGWDACEAKHRAGDEAERTVRNYRIVDNARDFVKVTLGRELFRFESFAQWVNKAQSWFKSAGISSTQFVCIDATGRICGMGKQFMSARDRGAFPIVVYHIEPESDAAMAEEAEGGV